MESECEEAAAAAAAEGDGVVLMETEDGAVAPSWAQRNKWTLALASHAVFGISELVSLSIRGPLSFDYGHDAVFRAGLVQATVNAACFLSMAALFWHTDAFSMAPRDEMLTKAPLLVLLVLDLNRMASEDHSWPQFGIDVFGYGLLILVASACRSVRGPGGVRSIETAPRFVRLGLLANTVAFACAIFVFVVLGIGGGKDHGKSLATFATLIEEILVFEILSIYAQTCIHGFPDAADGRPLVAAPKMGLLWVLPAYMVTTVLTHVTRFLDGHRLFDFGSPTTVALTAVQASINALIFALVLRSVWGRWRDWAFWRNLLVVSVSCAGYVIVVLGNTTLAVALNVPARVLRVAEEAFGLAALVLAYSQWELVPRGARKGGTAAFKNLLAHLHVFFIMVIVYCAAATKDGGFTKAEQYGVPGSTFMAVLVGVELSLFGLLHVVLH